MSAEESTGKIEREDIKGSCKCREEREREGENENCSLKYILTCLFEVSLFSAPFYPKLFFYFSSEVMLNIYFRFMQTSIIYFRARAFLYIFPLL